MARQVWKGDVIEQDGHGVDDRSKNRWNSLPSQQYLKIEAVDNPGRTLYHYVCDLNDRNAGLQSQLHFKNCMQESARTGDLEGKHFSPHCPQRGAPIKDGRKFTHFITAAFAQSFLDIKDDVITASACTIKGFLAPLKEHLTRRKQRTGGFKGWRNPISFCVCEESLRCSFTSTTPSV